MRELPLGSEMCECPTCHLFFSTTRNFDRHQIGPYHDNSRRCLTPQEMEAKGMFERRGRLATVATCTAIRPRSGSHRSRRRK